MRKTIKIESIKVDINKILLNSPDSEVLSRDRFRCFLSNLLQKTENYQGFRYLDKTEMLNSSQGKSFGIHDDLTFGETDRTRVHYF